MQFIEKFQEVKEATKSISGTSPGKTALASTANGGSTASVAAPVAPAVVPAAPTPATAVAVSSAINNSTSASANASPVNSRALAAANNLANSAAPAAYNDDKDAIMIKPECESSVRNYSLYSAPVVHVACKVSFRAR